MPLKDPEARREYNRRYRAANAEKVAEWEKSAYERNRDKKKARARSYYKANRERMMAWQREYNAEHAETYAEQQRERYLASAERNREIARKWRQENPELRRERDRAKRAKRRKAPVCDLTHAQWGAIRRAYRDRCIYCGSTPKRLEQDHIRALSRGGSHTASNIVPACPTCNNRKHAGSPPPFVIQPEMH